MVFAYHAIGVAFGGTQMDWLGNWRDPNSVSRTFFLVFPLWFGYIGVAIFFVISGFCIHLSSLKKHAGWLNYARRRFWRIYPPYAIALVLAIGLYLVTHSQIPISYENVVLHALLLHNLNESTIFSLNPSFWSIGTEVQLYVLYPLLVVLSQKISWNNTIKCCVITEIALGVYKGFINPHYPFWLGELPIAYVGSWALGAHVANNYASRNVRYYPTIYFAPLAAISLAAYFFKPLFPIQFLINAIMVAMLISNTLHNLISIGPKTLLDRLQHRWLINLGIISFSLYLLHQPLLELIGHTMTHFAPTLHPLVRLLVATLFAIPIYWLCCIFYREVERRCLFVNKPTEIAKPVQG